MNTVKFTFKDGKNKALTMSYDDGIFQDKRLIEIFNKHGIKGSFHINGGLFGAVHKHPRLFAEEIKDVYAGHEVSCHGYTHPFLEKLAPMEVVHEMLDDKKALEDACGYVVRGMSYPFGTYSDEVISIISKLGINYARTVVSTGKFNIPEDFMRWHATCHHNDKNLMTYLENLKNSTRDLQLMYVWGHAYEFDDNNNWEIIEKFCEEAGGDPDIWYATNIEIFDYVTAMRRCELSADRTMLYNPSAVSVWVRAEGKTVECKGGVMTKLN
ncbi:MAG: polysaccharide deacetylase family protein [Clostridia bacterium]|nr:polysaccharide deacetylase family protein [Clostridia bacterium]